MLCGGKEGLGAKEERKYVTPIIPLKNDEE
jgi:hypothetical protein